MDRKVIWDWLAKNYQFVAVIAMFLTAIGYPVRVEQAPPGTEPGIIILLPESQTGDGVAKVQDVSATWTPNERLAIRVGIAVLERKPDEANSKLLLHFRKLATGEVKLPE